MISASDQVRTAGKFFRLGGEKWLLKGVSYGPFEGPDSLPRPDRVLADLRQIAALGFNTLRLYVPPPEWFLKACAVQNLRVLVGLHWPAHTDFLRDRSGLRQILRNARAVVRELRGRPGVLGFVVANEVPAGLVRWMGHARVRRFLERLIAVCRRTDPTVLHAYATYPSTEYLSPRNADFFACNIYLEQRADYERYLARLQHVAGDRPLVITEFGLDARRHGEAAQDETLNWGWEVGLRAGMAGKVIFAWTDEWFTGGRDVSDAWGFGLLTRARREKEACASLRAWLPHLHRPGQAVRLHHQPRFSVIICTHNGSRTLRTALGSLQQLAYPDYEILVVDDGSTDSVPEAAAEFRDVRYLRIEHSGLSAARNHGAREATGEILAFLDDDAAADEDWLTYLTLAFEGERVGAAGGPNIPPPATRLVEACIAASPGGPAHVLVNDIDAEHLPGCNLAVTRAAWQEIGGFDERYRTAGDDVDFCWRLLDHGYRIAFHSGAMVWHARRRTFRAFFRQQIGYGEAEAMLIAHHRHRFGKLGGARWRGAIYEPARRALAATAFIYTGIFGSAPYQFLYFAPEAAIAEVVTSLPWALLAAACGLAAMWVPWLSVPALAMVAAPVLPAARIAWHVPEIRWTGRRWGGGLAARATVFCLALGQPFVRGTVRWFGCFRHGALPAGPWLTGPLFRRLNFRRRKAVGELALWNEHGRDRDLLLRSVLEELVEAKWPFRLGHEWSDWDFEIIRSRWWAVRCVTATECHHEDQRLTRVRLHTRARPLTVSLATLTAVIVIGLFCFRPPPWGLWALATTFLGWLALEFHHGAVASQVMRLLLHTAAGLGLRRLGESAVAPTETRRAGEE